MVSLQAWDSHASRLIITVTVEASILSIPLDAIPNEITTHTDLSSSLNTFRFNVIAYSRLRMHTHFSKESEPLVVSHQTAPA